MNPFGRRTPSPGLGRTTSPGLGRAENSRAGSGIELVGWTPAVERMTVMSRTLVSVLAATFATAVGLNLAGVAQTAFGWTALGFAALLGLSPIPWYFLRTRNSDRLPVWDLDEPVARLVARAADEAAVLRRLADRAPEGPVAEHLAHLAVTARGYVLALHQAAVQSQTAGQGRRDPELEATMTRVVAELAELSAAAARLREAQRSQLQSSPLEELRETTDRLTATIESDHLR